MRKGFSAFALLLVLAALLFAFYQRNSTGSRVVIFLAAQDIPAGVFLKPEMVQAAWVPPEKADSRTIHDFQELDGLTTLVPIPQGRPILYSQMSPSSKNIGPSCGHGPQCYFLTVSEKTGAGKLFSPGLCLYYIGRPGDQSTEAPLAVFPKVERVYRNPQGREAAATLDNFHIYYLDTAQAESAKALAGQPLRLELSDPYQDEILNISALQQN